jgi:hypothetical protein
MFSQPSNRFLLLLLVFASWPAAAAELTPNPEPRGKLRIVYVADANSDTNSVLPDTATADHLRAYIDTLASGGVDIFAQDVFRKQGVGWFWPEHADHAHFGGPVDRIPRETGPPSRSPLNSATGTA